MIYKNEDYEGEIVLDDITFETKLELGESALASASSAGEAKNENEQALHNLRVMKELLPTIKKHIAKVDLTRKSDNKVFKNYEALSKDAGAHTVISEVCGQFLGSIKGN